MESNGAKYISAAENLARLVRLETKVCLKFEELEKSIVLAREQVSHNRDLARNQVEYRLQGMNEFQKRMNKLEETFAVKENVGKDIDDLKDRINSNAKLLYIGIGVVLTLQIVFKFLIT